MAHATTITASALAFDQTMNGAYSLLDPITNIFYYLVPKLGTLFSGVKIRGKDDLGEHLRGKLSERTQLRDEISTIAKALGIEKVIPYFGNSFAGYGGKYSLTAPVVQIPSWHLIRNDGYGVLGDKDAKQPDTSDHWRYTDQETRFLISRSLVQIRMNDNLYKTIARVAMVAAIILFKVSPLTWPISLAILLVAVIGYFAVDRHVQKQLDSEAVKGLIKVSKDRLTPKELQDPEKLQKLKNEAVDAAISAIRKQKAQNLELKSKRRLANFLIDKEGNERFNLTAPSLSKRIQKLEGCRAQLLLEDSQESAPLEILSEAKVEEALFMGRNPFLYQSPLYWTKKQDKDDRRSADMICRIN